METTNNIKISLNLKDNEGNDMVVNIILNDECNNGREDFAITGTVWEKGKKRNLKKINMKKLVALTLSLVVCALSFGQGVPMNLKDSSKVVLMYSDGVIVEFTTTKNTTIVLDEKISVFIDVRNIKTNEVAMYFKNENDCDIKDIWNDEN